jgi:hypothetical protein
MRLEQALRELHILKEAAGTPAVQRSSAEHDAWKAKVIVVMRNALGADSSTLERFTQLRYSVGIWTGSPDEPERDRQYFAAQVLRASALIDAAIYEIELKIDSGGPRSRLRPPVLAARFFLSTVTTARQNMRWRVSWSVSPDRRQSSWMSRPVEDAR